MVIRSTVENGRLRSKPMPGHFERYRDFRQQRWQLNLFVPIESVGSEPKLFGITGSCAPE